MVVTRILSTSSYWSILMLVGLFLSLCSFSGVPVEQQPPQINKKEQRLEKKAQRLQTRLAKAKLPRARQRLQRRLQQLEAPQQQQEAPGFLLGLLSMIAGILGVGMFFIAVVSSVALAFSGGASASVLVGIYVAITLILGLTGLLLSILYFSKRKNDPDTYNLPGFAIAGIILSSIVTTLGFILVFGALSTL